MDIEACHRLPVKCNAVNVGKKVIIKFVNLKHAESILSKKFTLSSTDFSVTVSLWLEDLTLSR